MSQHDQLVKLFIINKFSELLNHIKFSKITIKEIVSIAMMHRNTFYNHFKDKYDLLDHYCYHFIGPILLNLDYHKFNYEPFKTLAKYGNLSLGKLTLNRLLQFQMNDDHFNDAMMSFMFHFILRNVEDNEAIWTIGKMTTVFQWNNLTNHHYDIFNDYSTLDRIIQTKQFPRD